MAGSTPQQKRVLHVYKTIFTAASIGQDAQSPIAEAHRALTVDKDRNEQILDDVQASLTQGRDCLVLTRRVVLVLGTTPFVGEGFDAPALDTLS